MKSNNGSVRLARSHVPNAQPTIGFHPFASAPVEKAANPFTLPAVQPPPSSRLIGAILFFATFTALCAQPTSDPAVPVRDSQFKVRFDAGAIVELRSHQDAAETEFVMPGRRLGDVVVRFREQDGDWQTINTAALTNTGAFTVSADGTESSAVFQISNRAAAVLALEIRFKILPAAIDWTMRVANVTDRPLEIGDLAFPLLMNSSARRGSTWVLKHGLVSGHGSFNFWMRPDSAPPYLVFTPRDDAKLEYWETQNREYRSFIYSAVAGAEARERGTKWRQPHTSLRLAPRGQVGDSKSHAFRFQWANDYDAVRQVIVDEGGIDVHVVPGMTVPTDLHARFALRITQAIHSVAAEFPEATRIESLGTNGDYRLYQVQFSRLGENRLTINYGDNRHMFLEFFSTEPLETLIKKRGAFLARSQHRDPSKWYNGLITDWNMATQHLISPEDYAPIPRNRYYAVTCDDPGLGKPAFLAAKNAEFPVSSEIEALDYYITNFVWGGLQQTTSEPYPYAIYGIPDWKTNRESADPGRNGQRHLWRVYDYPHIILMYHAMYRVANQHPQIRTALPAREYLQRAFGTARAMFTVPFEIERWSAYGTGFYNELVIVDLIADLEAAGLRAEANTLRDFWERKVRNFVNREQDLFRSEYAFDSTGFESTHALARYALLHADAPGKTNLGVSLENARRFMEKQTAANLFCRGVIEPAYYYLGSDYRGGGGNAYTLTYMAQMGGWSVLDYALNFATNAPPLLRLGYASYLSAWALMNTGTPESNYGYWFPGAANDGGAGGGFEPAPFGRTWLGPPHHRGSWNFSCEIDLGFCGALRTAATILADDPIFGRFCFGGDWRPVTDGVEIIPKDGLRKRITTALDARKLFQRLESGRFAAGQPVIIHTNGSRLSFALESDNPESHRAELRITGLPPGRFQLKDDRSAIGDFSVTAGDETVVQLPVAAGSQVRRFTIVAQE
jgi:hypothetical protein